MKTFKALSLLLSYPQAGLCAAVGDIRAVLRAEGLLAPDQMAALEPLLQSLAQDDLYDLQEHYVLLFDRSRTLSLNLFEHVHGESRDRGGAMVDLLETYRRAGLDLQGHELPDHLPVLLEFLSTQALDEARGMLADAGPILVALGERLTRRQSPYAAVLDSLVAVAQAGVDSPEAQALLTQPDDDPEDLAALDAVWEEAQVTFGPDTQAGCPAPGGAGTPDIPVRIRPRAGSQATQAAGGKHA